MSQTLQASAGDVVTYSHRVEVDVAVAVASRTRSSCPGLSQGIAIVTVFTHLTAHPYTEREGREEGREEGERSGQELDG